ncbi:MAG: type I-U CRISPR-associated protein Csx17 [Thermoflexales bacterium]|nr:type I-U CRISPR-associated protein Csx17 [Thermoflexales bacterium]
MNSIRFSGCRPEPLLAYLKALGIFRLVAEQADETVRACWRDDVLTLDTRLDEAALAAFFEQTYVPTPIVAPWAGGSGFFSGDNHDAVDAIAGSANPRLAPYREVIAQVRTILAREGQTTKPQKERKALLLRLYRREMPDSFVAWMDSAIVLQSEGQKFPPVLGTGGNDGRLDFSQNLMQRLVDLGFCDDGLDAHSTTWLRNALYGDPADGLLANAIGQFDPGRAGGPNATQGLDGKSRVNPWEYVLMLEGALLLAGSATRRLDANARDKAAFPFTVDASSVGNGSLSAGEEARGEIWLPVWENVAGYGEVKALFAEGRAQLGRRQARTAIDFARAIAGLGVDRGLSGFQRYAFLKRSGKSYLATSLGRFETRTVVRDADLLGELDSWLDGFRRACNGDIVPARFTRALRELDGAIYEYCRFGGGVRFGAILRALGRCERELTVSRDKPGIVGSSKGTVQPVPLLSTRWLAAAEERSAEFRIALALAAIRSTGEVGPLRTNLEGVMRNPWGLNWADPEDRASVVWTPTTLPRNLQAVIERRLVDATRLGVDRLPIESSLPAPASDIAAYLSGELDDSLIEAWLWGLMLVDLTAATRLSPNGEAEVRSASPLPRAYALLKLVHLPGYSALTTSDGRPLRPEPAILSHLRAWRLDEACNLATRRLRATGYVVAPGPASGGPMRPTDFSVSSVMQDRLASALLIPLAKPESLRRLVLRQTNVAVDA